MLCFLWVCRRHAEGTQKGEVVAPMHYTGGYSLCNCPRFPFLPPFPVSFSNKSQKSILKTTCWDAITWQLWPIKTTYIGYIKRKRIIHGQKASDRMPGYLGGDLKLSMRNTLKKDPGLVAVLFCAFETACSDTRLGTDLLRGASPVCSST